MGLKLSSGVVCGGYPLHPLCYHEECSMVVAISAYSIHHARDKSACSYLYHSSQNPFSLAEALGLHGSPCGIGSKLTRVVRGVWAPWTLLCSNFDNEFESIIWWMLTIIFTLTIKPTSAVEKHDDDRRDPRDWSNLSLPRRFNNSSFSILNPNNNPALPRRWGSAGCLMR